MKENSTVVLTGNWMGSKVTSWLKERNPDIDFISLIGLSHMDRVEKAFSLLQGREYQKMIGFSSGCSILAELERANAVASNVDVVYAAPAPQKGVPFRANERTFEKTLRYFPELAGKSVLDKRVALTKEDFLSLFEGEMDQEIVRLLEPESARFMLQQIFGQAGFAQKLQKNDRRWGFKSHNDYLLGSTQDKSFQILKPSRFIKLDVPGHFGPMLQLGQIVSTTSELSLV